MKKFLFVVAAAIVLLAGCSKWRNEEPEFTFNIQAMNLEGAKAMAHLQSEAGTKASVGFEQEDALYLVYDNNEIRLPEISFTVEVPDSYSEWDKKQLMKDVHVSIGNPTIKDFGNYIYVYSSLGYYTTFNGSFVCPPIAAMGPGSQNSVPHSNALIRKSDGQCLTIDDNIGDVLYWSYLMAEDSHGQCYFFSLFSRYLYTLVDTRDGFELISTDAFINNGRLMAMFELNDNIYVAQSGRDYDPESGSEILTTVVGKVSSNLSCEMISITGEFLAFEKYGKDGYLFINDGTTFEVYNVSSGCKLVASATVEEGLWDLRLISAADGVYTYYFNGAIVRFDVKNAECTISKLDKTIYEHLIHGYLFVAGEDFYQVNSPWDSDYAEVLKIDVLAGTVEQLARTDVPEGYYFNGNIFLEDESMGKIKFHGRLVNQNDVSITEDVPVQEIFDPEIAEAYAKAQAEANYGIDFGSYKVVTVVPLDESLESSGK